MNVLLVVGNDKISKRLLSVIANNKNLVVAMDCTSNFKRVFSVIKRGKISIVLALKMFFAELFRDNVSFGFENECYQIRGNDELKKIIRDKKIDILLLFRAGLIINKGTLDSVGDIMNIHCAKIPEYGGLGAIQRAIDNKDFKQAASLHKVTEKIDDGVVLDVEPYELKAACGYKKNEDLAYNAGMKLALRALQSFLN